MHNLIPPKDMSSLINDARKIACYDPYDLWGTHFGGNIRRLFYDNNLCGKYSAVVLSAIDWLIPGYVRNLLDLKYRYYPIVLALDVMTSTRISTKKGYSYMQMLKRTRCHNHNGWGLGFPWMSKNGFYAEDIPFITHTPYVMEALLELIHKPSLTHDAMFLFHDTWRFLESLKVMHEENDVLAVSYAPVNETRIVVNANSYAAYAYALHAIHGLPAVRASAQSKALKLVRWVTQEQSEDGSWPYYADTNLGNFIDCFHSCFVIKNLVKVRKLIPDSADIINDSIGRGWSFIRNTFYDNKSRLCLRFSIRSHLDPYRWDLYDQAEYLGLLVDFGELDEATRFADYVATRFSKGTDWYCRIDIFGRRWGKNFLRWGIVPFWYHRARLNSALTRVS